MQEEKVLKLKEEIEFKELNNLKFNKNQEFEVVNRVVYIGGYMLPPEMQNFILTWIENNPNSFEDVTRNW